VTLIVSFVHGEQFGMFGDSGIVSTNEAIDHRWRTPKVLLRRRPGGDPVLFGFSGTLAGIQSYIRGLQNAEDPVSYYYETSGDEEIHSKDVWSIMAYRLGGEVVRVYTDYGAQGEPADDIFAVGSGAAWFYGAYYALGKAMGGPDTMEGILNRIAMAHEVVLPYLRFIEPPIQGYVSESDKQVSGVILPVEVRKIFPGITWKLDDEAVR